MSRDKAGWAGRAALMTMFLALLSLFAIALYFAARPVPLSPTGTEEDLIGKQTRRLSAVLLTTILAGVAILIFVLGGLLLLRIGRRVTEEQVGGEETEMTDVWASARVTDADMEMGDELLRDAQRPDPPEDERPK
ncbi:MAG: hypothetical protein SF069_06945 [Phycisphaerae bacterium]|nr:hypothetical protein [Phycisphaerae bacterium]